jgi:DNA primase
VPLADLVGAYNELYERDGGLVESAHEPIHGSKSGRCLLIDTQKGRWWCRSCRQHGDAASFVMAVHGWQYGQATAWLAERYGAPSGAHTTATNRGTPTSTPRRGQIRWRAL